MQSGQDLSDVPWMFDGYQQWLDIEGVPVVEAPAVDLTSVETVTWPRMGVPGVFVHASGRGDLCSMYVLDLPPGGATEPAHHLYEASYFVIDGHGSATVTGPADRRRSLEWGRASLFSLPVNAPYRLFNASGTRRARIAVITNLPMVMKQFRNERFVFGTDFEFTERWGEDQYFRGAGRFIETWEQRHMWETSIVPDLIRFDQLRSSPHRGTGSANIQLVLGESTMHAHISEVGVGNYKKAHVHGAGAHIIQLGDGGYSLYWYPGEQPRRVNWSFAMLHAPDAGEWHQHFNVSDAPSRYLAMSYGGYRYPFTQANRENIMRRYSKKSAIQIEYEDEDPAIRQLFNESRAAFIRKRAVVRSAE